MRVLPFLPMLLSALFLAGCSAEQNAARTDLQPGLTLRVVNEAGAPDDFRVVLTDPATSEILQAWVSTDTNSTFTERQELTLRASVGGFTTRAQVYLTARTESAGMIEFVWGADERLRVRGDGVVFDPDAVLSSPSEEPLRRIQFAFRNERSQPAELEIPLYPYRSLGMHPMTQVFLDEGERKEKEVPGGRADLRASLYADGRMAGQLFGSLKPEGDAGLPGQPPVQVTYVWGPQRLDVEVLHGTFQKKS